MANRKAREIIEAAMSDENVYRAMAAKEAQVWSRILTDPRREKVTRDDQKAAAELGLNRGRLSLASLIQELGFTPEFCLSLGCGSGRAERVLLQNGIGKAWHGVDIAEDAIASARRIAAEQSLNITYEVQDLNFINLRENSYELVVAQTSLHHVLRLEHVADQVSNALRSDGVLWLHDYVGESQFQFSDERLTIVNDLLRIIPERLRWDHLRDRPHDNIVRKEPGNLVSPFESIRSEDIKDVFLSRFQLVRKFETSSFLHRVVLKGTRRNYLKNEDTRAIFEILFYFDKLLVEKGMLPPASGQYLLQKRQSRSC